MSENSPFQWSADEYRAFGSEPIVCRHRYHEDPAFDTDALTDLIDTYPRGWLQAFTMGTDPCRAQDWKSVDIPDGMSGAEIWRAVANGRLWVNLTHVEDVSAACASLIGGMYAHLGSQCPSLHEHSPGYSTLLISSPRAQVYFHVDSQPNMLWHLRGTKRVWVYPALDPRLTPQTLLEDIYAGEIDEDLPFDPAFDEIGQAYSLSPGDVISWPHNAPHRVENDDMNVSLTTSYYAPAIYRRQYVQLANRFLLRNLGVRNRSMAETGVIPSLKRVSYRLINKVRPFARRDRAASYVTDLAIDPDAPLGYRNTGKMRPASFSRAA